MPTLTPEITDDLLTTQVQRVNHKYRSSYKDFIKGFIKVYEKKATSERKAGKFMKAVAQNDIAYVKKKLEQQVESSTIAFLKKDTDKKSLYFKQRLARR